MPPLPHVVVYLWRIFRRLSNRRGGTGAGPAPISWEAIRAFQHLTGTALAPWEVEIIEELDAIYLSEMAKSLNASSQPEPSAPS